MPRTVTATETKARLGELMRYALESGDAIIVENRGQPQIALVPYAEYEVSPRPPSPNFSSARELLPDRPRPRRY